MPDHPEPLYQLLVTESDLLALERAAELSGRLHMGQTWAVAEHVDRAGMTPEGRSAFRSALDAVTHFITGLHKSAHARYPTDRARQAGERAFHLQDHLRYAQTADPDVRPLAFAPNLARRLTPRPPPRPRPSP
ncbi:hypothetical protein IHN32_11570 [Deinococcus sp. 14RED07]|uniref:hypothetical protein n=1 Tax=Deinococcus sp. 14RED07 TaxID=2745874 RepID=UPI001E61A374|nr:hypothetical protein [Deinococcus sp. 14RED07]MCD0176579.1 hypothetical protein [Deinococcus sp. 14RED07]